MYLDVEDTDSSLTILAYFGNEKALMRATILLPDGRQPIDSKFTSSTVINVEPTIRGRYSLVITNMGHSAESVSVFFGHLLGTDDSYAFLASYGTGVAGLLLTVGGEVVAITGFVVNITEKRKV